ncbi:hypothetical protein YYG_01720 [Plasmodium vinckei petteri]|uniref:Pre-mRNA-processing factor 6, putative n=1 Tax=Plasmodium vinckei petteri TaxID=138298 RepID=W7ALN3_PLAVN|nr:hypothetical protein YYG_01720 [Plasmodium vinckei petteri]CAD2103679.1 pre-mRNA-processing factor 6, putative [Plasmodium vinckei petteri]
MKSIKNGMYNFNPSKEDPFGKAPAGYVAGKGRGVTGFSGGVSRDDITEDKDKNDYSDFNYDEFHGYSESLFKDTEYDEEDKEADDIYEAIDSRMDVRRKSRRENKLKEEILKMRAQKPTIQEQFSDLKKNLANVTLEEWESIPNVLNYSRQKQKKMPKSYLPAPDSLIMNKLSESNSHLNYSGSSGNTSGLKTPLGMKTPLGIYTPIGLGFQTPLLKSSASSGIDTPLFGKNNRSGSINSGLSTPFTLSGYATPFAISGYATPLNSSNISGYNTPLISGGANNANNASMLSLNDLGEARGTVLSVKLDELIDNVEGQTVIDPKGYLTNLNAKNLTSDSDIADINKARSLLKSVINTNRKHGPGWIAAARVEELAQRKDKAKEIIMKGCIECSKNEDVWLEAVRLEDKLSEAKIILAKAIKNIPTSVKLWLEAYKKEKNVQDKRKVLRKAIECIPNSVVLWKEAISLENENNAYILLKRAVECIPQCIEMWIALARLCKYSEAQKVLNEARKQIPTSAEIWINASKLEEKQGNINMVDVIIKRCIENLSQKNVVHERDKWIKFAEECEQSDFLHTCQSIIKNTMNIGVENLNKKRIYKQDAQNCINNKSLHTARCIYNEALKIFKTKKSLWLDLANLELAHGNQANVDDVLQRAVKNCPHSSVLWLMYAKQKWLNNEIDAARKILAESFMHNQNTEVISLAAVKLERENNEFERARVLLKKSRVQCNTPKIWMQSVQLERLLGNYDDAKELVHEALKIHKKFDKLYMIAGQIELEMVKLKEDNGEQNEEENLTSAYDKAQQIYQQGLKFCPDSINLWLCAIDLQITKKSYTSARALVEKAKIKIKNIHSLSINTKVLKNKEIIESNEQYIHDEEIPSNLNHSKNGDNNNDNISNSKNELENKNINASVKVIENYDLLWLKLIEIELLCNNQNINPIISEALKECPTSGILWSKAIELENKNLQNSKSVTAFNNCGNNSYVILIVAIIFWNNYKIVKARKWFYRAITLNPSFGDGWATFLAFEIDQENEINQKDIINKCIKAEPNRGYMWNKITKRRENWRLNYPQKMYKYIKERFPQVLNKPISENILKIISDENVVLPTSQTDENAEQTQKSDDNDEDSTLDNTKNNKRKEASSKSAETTKKSRKKK